MYTDKKKRIWLRLLVVALAVVLAVGIFQWTGKEQGKTVAKESASALKAAVQRCANQCYAVEGVYPPNLSYMEEHYGLQVNHTKFYVSYDAFASNIPPDIRVTAREG